MPELTREEKLKLVEKLPQQLQDLLYSEDTGAFLLYLGQKYNLPDEKVSLLSKLVADVVLRIVPITSLAQEINSKITSDAQAAMNLAQELNTELLAVPVPTLPSVEAKSLSPNVPKGQSEFQQKAISGHGGDKYREPTIGPEVVDLRKAPPPPVFTPQPKAGPPLAEKPITPPLTFTRPIEPVVKPVPPAPVMPPIPLTPITPSPQPKTPVAPTPQPPLIAAPEGGEPRPSGREAEPHIPVPKEAIPAPGRPQYIMRPSGLPPTDLPENVLDLRKDKGEF